MLKIIVVKYENEIPWQSKVRNQADLFDFVASEMLPRVRNRVSWPPVHGAKHCFVTAQKLDLNRMLEAGQELDSEDIEIVRLLRDENGVEEATEALATIINASKVAAFKEWTDLFDGKYARHPAFGLLVLRPIINKTGAGSWRTVMSPSASVLKWLFHRLTTESLSPVQKIINVYADKLGAGLYHPPANGWQYVSQGSNPDQLVAACRDTGWCIADRLWATRYLRENCFYLLRENNRVKVALRVRMDSGGQCVVECQGLYNRSPEKFWIDITLFVRSLNITVDHRLEEQESALKELGNIESKDQLWWEMREHYWPFARIGLPAARQVNSARRNSDVLTPYLHFPSIGRILTGREVTLTVADWVNLVEVRPNLYTNVPKSIIARPEIFDACVRGWTGQLGEREMDFDTFLEIPYNIRSHEPFQKRVRAVFPDFLKRCIVPSERAWEIYLPSPTMQEELGLSGDIDFQNEVEDAYFYLLRNAYHDYPDRVFEGSEKTVSEYPAVRQEVWSLAIESFPPLWFALPEDLRVLEEFQPKRGDVKRVNLDAWEVKLRERPWMLTQRNVVPKSIRLHARVLDSYLQGWLMHFCKKPWQTGVKRGLYGKVMHMVPTICYHPGFIDGVALIFCNRRNQLPDAWSQAKGWKLQEASWYQLAILRALDPEKLEGGLRRCERQIIEKIADLQDKADESSQDRSLAEVRDRLNGLGFTRHSRAA